jgi:hypothetical protein
MCCTLLEAVSKNVELFQLGRAFRGILVGHVMVFRCWLEKLVPREKYHNYTKIEVST